MIRRGGVLAALLTALVLSVGGQEGAERPRPGLEGLAWQDAAAMHAAEAELVQAIREPMLKGLDCSLALEHWFSGRLADSRGDKEAAIAAWRTGSAALVGLRPLPPVDRATPAAARVTPQSRLDGAALYLVAAFAAHWQSEGGRQHGLLILPASRPRGHQFPLLLYLHDGLDGIAHDEIVWLAEQCRKGYAVLAPARPGSALVHADTRLSGLADCRSAGDGADLAAAARSAVAAVRGALQLPAIRPSGYAAVGVGVGADTALLAAAHGLGIAAVASLDASRLIPSRLYWERMARGENRWPGWSAFCSRDPITQLRAMQQESAILAAPLLACPVLLILPEADRDTVAGAVHREVQAALQRTSPAVALHYGEVPARAFLRDRTAPGAGGIYRHLDRFLYQHWPPDGGVPDLGPEAPRPQADTGDAP